MREDKPDARPSGRAPSKPRERGERIGSSCEKSTRFRVQCAFAGPARHQRSLHGPAHGTRGNEDRAQVLELGRGPRLRVVFRGSRPVRRVRARMQLLPARPAHRRLVPGVSPRSFLRIRWKASAGWSDFTSQCRRRRESLWPPIRQRTFENPDGPRFVRGGAGRQALRHSAGRRMRSVSCERSRALISHADRSLPFRSRQGRVHVLVHDGTDEGAPFVDTMASPGPILAPTRGNPPRSP